MTSAFDEFFGPMPNRPDHPDFAQLCGEIFDMDIRSVNGSTPDDLMAEIVDPDTVKYMAFQRCIRALGIETASEVRTHLAELSRLMAVYLDAFMLGSRWGMRRRFD